MIIAPIDLHDWYCIFRRYITNFHLRDHILHCGDRWTEYGGTIIWNRFGIKIGLGTLAGAYAEAKVAGKPAGMAGPGKGKEIKHPEILNQYLP